MKILVLNSGSSSLKFQLIELPQQEVLFKGTVEEIGSLSSQLNYQTAYFKQKLEVPIQNHEIALRKVADLLMSAELNLIRSVSEISAIGHRVVHGGEVFKQTTVVDEQVKIQIQKLSSLAPLHNPANLMGIEVAESIFKGVKQYTVFDTAFYAQIPEFAYRYAVPSEWYTRYGVRVYGFHGTSHQYVYGQALEFLNLPAQNKVVTIHLGNGCSISAIQNGQCVDTSMGMGPLSGLMMGTRSGDIDPSVIFHLVEQGLDLNEVKKALNSRSGLKGLTGENDLRIILERWHNGDPSSQLALKMYVYRIQKFIGAYAASMGGLDAVVFTAGVGENSHDVRKMVCDGLGFMGIELDHQKNEERSPLNRMVSHGKTPVCVIPTNEELAIALESLKV